jgi:hypothetical protein
MKWFVSAGSPAGVFVCALLSVTSAARAQESPPASAPPETSQPVSEPQAAPTEGTALPSVVVTAPAEKKKGKKKKVEPSKGGGNPSEGVSGVAAPEGGLVEGEAIPMDGVVLGGAAVSDTGTTVFDSKAVNTRTDGSGDANTFLRNLPNVQYQNDTSTDAGMTLQETIDTRPLLLSINGARTYENNFILNGVSINSITGPAERQSVAMSDSDQLPNLNVIYGLHPQTVFVPSEFIGTATIIDSNASAEYGEFQGGVVIYDLATPPTDRYRASVTYSRETDQMMNYILGTPNGTNPLAREAPTFEKNNLAVSLGAPITNEFAFIAQASRRTAETSKQKTYEYFDEFVDEESDNVFMRLATSLKTGVGLFTFDTSHTDYEQNWQSPKFRDLEMEVETKSSSTQIEYLGALAGISNAAIGLNGVTLKSRAYYNKSDTGNYAGANEAYAWVGSRQSKINGVWVETFRSTEFEDWCRAIPSSAAGATATSNNTTCYEGGYGNSEQGQTDYGVQAQLKGNIFLGNFLIGGEAKTYEGRRARLEDFTYYSSFTPALSATPTALPNPRTGYFVCPPGDPLCTSEQYNRVKIVNPAYDITAAVDAIHSYAELDQTLGWFNVRAGVRVDYEDYFKNVNVAPRLAGSITPLSGLTFTGGYNRYYLGETLYYAIRDGQPRTTTHTRGAHNTTTGVVPSTWTVSTQSKLDYKSADLATPFTDEYSGAVRVRDPLLGGSWRLRYLERYGEDQFAGTNCGSSVCKELTNNGESFYRSATAEYSKFWSRLSNPFNLSGVGIVGTVTWSEQTVSDDTFQDEDEYLELIKYKGKSYTEKTFTAVTGNLDIPVRFGGTLTTSWFNDRLFLNLSAGYNLGYDGVYDTGEEVPFGEEGKLHHVYEDTTFKPVLMLDLDGQIAVTEQAAIEFHVNNVLNSPGNAIATNQNPWLVGRSYWVGSTVKF